MKRYIVISPHTDADCIMAYKQTLAIGYITHFDWGCRDGVHIGWAILEAENKAQAIMSVPTFLRDQATVVQLTKFEPAAVEAMHPQ